MSTHFCDCSASNSVPSRRNCWLPLPSQPASWIAVRSSVAPPATVMHFPEDRTTPEPSCHRCAAEPSHVSWYNCTPSDPLPRLRHFPEAATTRARPVGATGAPDGLFLGVASVPAFAPVSAPAASVADLDGERAPVVGDEARELGESDGEGGTDGDAPGGRGAALPPRGGGAVRCPGTGAVLLHRLCDQQRDRDQYGRGDRGAEHDGFPPTPRGRPRPPPGRGGRWAARNG